jgi:hypothetical protein
MSEVAASWRLRESVAEEEARTRGDIVRQQDLRAGTRLVKNESRTTLAARLL